MHRFTVAINGDSPEPLTAIAQAQGPDPWHQAALPHPAATLDAVVAHIKRFVHFATPEHAKPGTRAP